LCHGVIKQVRILSSDFSPSEFFSSNFLLLDVLPLELKLVPFIFF